MWGRLPNELQEHIIGYLPMSANLASVSRWFSRVVPAITITELRLDANTQHLDLAPLTRLRDLTIEYNVKSSHIIGLPLSSLNIRCRKFDGEHVCSLTSLTSLNIRHALGVSDKTMTALTNLRELNLDSNDMVTGRSLSTLTKLETLNISYNYNIQAHHVFMLTNITTLVIRKYSDVKIIDLKAFPLLTSLDLHANDLDVSRLNRLTALTRLDISSHSHAHAYHISALTNLTWLDTRKSYDITNISLPRLRVLKTSATAIDVSNDCRVVCASWPTSICHAHTMKLIPCPAAFIYAMSVINLTLVISHHYQIIGITRLTTLRTLRIINHDNANCHSIMERLRECKIGHQLDYFTYKGYPELTLEGLNGRALPRQI